MRKTTNQYHFFKGSFFKIFPRYKKDDISQTEPASQGTTNTMWVR